MNRAIDMAVAVKFGPINQEIVNLIMEGHVPWDEPPPSLAAALEREINDSASAIQGGIDPAQGEDAYETLVAHAWESFNAFAETLDDFADFCEVVEGEDPESLSDELRRELAKDWLWSKMEAFEPEWRRLSALRGIPEYVAWDAKTGDKISCVGSVWEVVDTWPEGVKLKHGTTTWTCRYSELKERKATFFHGDEQAVEEMGEVIQSLNPYGKAVTPGVATLDELARLSWSGGFAYAVWHPLADRVPGSWAPATQEGFAEGLAWMRRRETAS